MASLLLFSLCRAFVNQVGAPRSRFEARTARGAGEVKEDSDRRCGFEYAQIDLPSRHSFPEEPVSFEVGDYAILDGFTERTSLNGEPVELLRWDEEKQGWVVQSQIEDVKRLVSLQNIKPYPRRQATPAPKKDREFNIVSFLATILGTIIIGGTAIAVLGVLGLAFYKDWTGEYLLTLDGLPSTT